MHSTQKRLGYMPLLNVRLAAYMHTCGQRCHQRHTVSVLYATLRVTDRAHHLAHTVD